MANVTVAEKEMCKCEKEVQDIVFIGQFLECEGGMLDTFYCKTCNHTWHEL